MISPKNVAAGFSTLGVGLDYARHHWNWQPGQPRVFIHQFDHEEHHCLHYILENLAQKNILMLWPLQNEMKKKGDALEHVHPLSFFMHILSHTTLRSHFNQLREKNNKAWKEFLKGALKSFTEEHRHRNISDDHIETFCSRTGKDVHHVRHAMHHGQWENFIKSL